MSKTGKKKFNKFIWLYWKMKNKKNKKNLGGFPVVGREKMIKKKKNCVGKLGYCPSSSFGSRYNGIVS